jgi:hypothetical protein
VGLSLATLDARQRPAGRQPSRQLKADARSVLTPAQLAERDRWMDNRIIPEVNRILASRNTTPR